MVFCFGSEICFRTTQELEYLLILSREAQFFFQNLTLGYMTKTLNQIIFFFKLNGRSLMFCSSVVCPFDLFLLAIALSFLLQFTVSDYPIVFCISMHIYIYVCMSCWSTIP
jgi:hypothetical protein